MKALKCFKPMNKRIVYIGAERVGLVCLQKLMDLGKNVVAVLTADDNKKIQALKCYERELRKFPHPRSLEGIEILAKKRGLEIGFPASEAFVVLREKWE